MIPKIFTPGRVLGAAAALVATAAQAHTGHDTGSFFAGLVHPFGIDHLLAMVAVGAWSVTAGTMHRAWHGPALFMASLWLAALAGQAGVALPMVEHAIAVSVVVLGVLLVAAARALASGRHDAHPDAASSTASVRGLMLVAVAGALHGLAHGAEAPESSAFATYAAGFLVATAALHAAGLAFAWAVQRWWQRRAAFVLGGAGALLGLAGGVLLGQA